MESKKGCYEAIANIQEIEKIFESNTLKLLYERYTRKIVLHCVPLAKLSLLMCGWTREFGFQT